MAWRGLHISRRAHLSLDRSRLKIRGLEDDDPEPLFFPLEDIAWIVLDNTRSTLSARLLAACMEAGVLVVFSDQRHHPCGLALSFHQHYAQTEVSRAQLSLTGPFMKRAWQAIVRAKIRNQAENLRLAQHPDAPTLKAMAKKVLSGDPKNVEARAARYYWSRLFAAFKRSDQEDLRNGLLNYGYACVRAALARSLVAVGFLPSVGLHHDGRFNAFNLVDDLLEAYRPVVDWAVVEHLRTREDEDDALSLDDRRAMAAILTRDILLDGEQLSVLHATERSADSLRRAVQSGDVTPLLLPEGW